MRGSSKKEESVAKSARVVVTGKRFKGAWCMESSLEPKVRRSSTNEGVVVSENRRVRTLH